MPKGRVEKEKQMIQVMIDIYCSRIHKVENLCEECQKLREYALKRLEFCKFGDEKTSCRKCPIQCYKKDMKIKTREVMKFSGPRLILYHPLELIKHLFY